MPEWPEMAIGRQSIRDQGMMGGPPERPEMAIARVAGDGDRPLESTLESTLESYI